VFRSIQAATAAQIEWSRRVEDIDVRREGVEVKETAERSKVSKGGMMWGFYRFGSLLIEGGCNVPILLTTYARSSPFSRIWTLDMIIRRTIKGHKPQIGAYGARNRGGHRIPCSTAYGCGISSLLSEVQAGISQAYDQYIA